MRTISGSRKGHKLAEFEGMGIRPTTDRVKESIFNLIWEYVPQSCVLDLFAGSGALGLEALSRGARRAVFVDAARASVEVVKKNTAALRFDDCAEIHNIGYAEFFRSSKERFDIIFLDPPYNKGFIGSVLEDIDRNCRLTENGIVVLESDSTDMHDALGSLEIIKQKKYGRSYVTVYQRR